MEHHQCTEPPLENTCRCNEFYRTIY